MSECTAGETTALSNTHTSNDANIARKRQTSENVFNFLEVGRLFSALHSFSDLFCPHNNFLVTFEQLLFCSKGRSLLKILVVWFRYHFLINLFTYFVNPIAYELWYLFVSDAMSTWTLLFSANIFQIPLWRVAWTGKTMILACNVYADIVFVWHHKYGCGIADIAKTLFV